MQPEDAATLDRIFDAIFSETFAHLYRPEDLDAFLTSFGIARLAGTARDPAFAFRLAEVGRRAGRLCKARAP